MLREHFGTERLVILASAPYHRFRGDGAAIYKHYSFVGYHALAMTLHYTLLKKMFYLIMLLSYLGHIFKISVI